MAPVSGAASDTWVLRASATLASAFGAELLVVYAPADVAELIPWIGDGYAGGVQSMAVEGLQRAASDGAAAAQASFEQCNYERKTFLVLKSPVWSAMAAESRLSDVLVFDDQAARGRGPLAHAFQQIIAHEQRPTIVARSSLAADGVVAVAWDGGKEASRAVRTALPLLDRASRVLILNVVGPSGRKCDPRALQAFLQARGISSEAESLPAGGEAGLVLIKAAAAAGAAFLVAGAFGHTRLREFVFGGATRCFLHSDGPSLFLSH
jgi:nucleotide-binding universal stress UspA family protein